MFDGLVNGFTNMVDGLVNSFTKTFITDDRWMSFVQGFGNTLIIALFATLLGVMIGLVIAIVKVTHAQGGKLKILNAICCAYTAVIRGTPIVVQLLIMYNIILVAVPDDLVLITAVLTFGINSGAYVSEIIRGGIQSIDRGQMEAGRSLGLTQGQTMKSIILPQAVKNILPALGNEFIALLKETSVVGYIAVLDLTRAADLVKSRTFEPFFPLISIAVIYFILVMGISKLIKIAERRLAKSDRR